MQYFVRFLSQTIELSSLPLDPENVNTKAAFTAVPLEGVSCDWLS